MGARTAIQLHREILVTGVKNSDETVVAIDVLRARCAGTGGACLRFGSVSFPSESSAEPLRA